LASHLPQQSSAPATKLTTEKLRLSSDGNEDDHAERIVSDSELDDIIGISDSSALEVIELICLLKVSETSLLYDFSSALIYIL
jgi:hypothetical protein